MITKVLIKLLEAPVKPEHPIDFIRDNLGATMYERNQIEQLEQQVNDYKKEVTELKQEIDELKSKLHDTESVAVTLTNGNAKSETTVNAGEKVAETAASASVPSVPTINGGAKIDDSVDDKISESEKAIAPASVATDDVPVIEAATADEQSSVPTECNKDEATAAESPNVNVGSNPESTKKVESAAESGTSTESTTVVVAEKEKLKTEATEKIDAGEDAKPTPSTKAADTQK